MQLYIALIYLEEIETTEGTLKRFDYNGCSKISVVMEHIATASERV